MTYYMPSHYFMQRKIRYKFVNFTLLFVLYIEKK